MTGKPPVSSPISILPSHCSFIRTRKMSAGFSELSLFKFLYLNKKNLTQKFRTSGVSVVWTSDRVVKRPKTTRTSRHPTHSGLARSYWSPQSTKNQSSWLNVCIPQHRLVFMYSRFLCERFDLQHRDVVVTWRDPHFPGFPPRPLLSSFLPSFIVKQTFFSLSSLFLSLLEKYLKWKKEGRGGIF